MTSPVPPPLAAAGVTYRMLDYWVRKGYLRPDNPSPGTGRIRRWPAGEVRVGLTMARLVAAGVQPADAAAAARAARTRQCPARVAGMRRRRVVYADLSPDVAVRVVT